MITMGMSCGKKLEVLEGERERKEKFLFRLTQKHQGERNVLGNGYGRN